MADIIPLNFNATPKKLMVGLAWDHNEQESRALGTVSPHDFDLGCILYNAQKTEIGHISATNPQREKYGKEIFHSGDHQSGASEFEDETITVNLDSIGSDIHTLAFYVSAKDGTKLDTSASLHVDYKDATNLSVFAAHYLEESLASAKVERVRGIVYAGVLTRTPRGWGVKKIQGFAAATGANDIGKALGAFI
jgi:stress response protein SCP2